MSKTFNIQTRVEVTTLAKLIDLLSRHYNRHIRSMSQLINESLKTLVLSAEQQGIVDSGMTESQAESLLTKHNLLIGRLDRKQEIESIINENALRIADKRLLDIEAIDRISESIDSPIEEEFNLSGLEIVKD